MKIKNLFQKVKLTPLVKQITLIVITMSTVIAMISITAILGAPDKRILDLSKNESAPGSYIDNDSTEKSSENQSTILSQNSTNKSGSGIASSISTNGQKSTILSSSIKQSSQTSTSASTTNTLEKQYYKSEVGIWYTVWWQDNKANNPYKGQYQHWADWSRMEPIRGYYSSGDSEIIKTHMNLFEKYGIDYVILDDTNGHGNDAGSIGSNIDKIFATVNGMGAGNAPELAIALGGEFNNGEAADPYGTRVTEANLIYSRYATSYNDIYFKWKNKPLLISYGLVKYQSWDDNRFTVRRATGNVNEWRFSGTALPSTGIWGWVFNSQVNTQEVYGVIPGFNKGAIQGDTANSVVQQIRREQGNHYMQMWLDAIKANRETIVISAWNDFAEEPSIEAMKPRSDAQIAIDSARVGYPYDVRHARDLQNGTDRHNVWLDYYGNPVPYWYEEITWAYTSLKTTLLDGYYYKEEGSSSSYQYKNGQLIKQDKLPAGHPLIRIPAGYLNWFASK